MSKLSLLRSRLGDLRRRRLRMRWGMAASGLTAAVLGILAAVLLVDWSFEPGRPQRLVTLLLVVAAVVWAYRRFARPWLGQQESDLDMALLVEREQHIDSDLVAALQFESPAGRDFGSPALKAAVVDYVADFGNDLRVDQGFDRRPLLRRAGWAAAGLAAVGLFAACWPGHAAAFLNRLLLGRAHYPTQTKIQAIHVAGQLLLADTDDIRGPVGQPLNFAISAAGELPEHGRIDLRTAADGLETTIDLLPAADNPSEYRAALPRLVDGVAFQIYLGDAWTDPRSVTAIPLPIVNVSLVGTPPDYAAAAASEKSDGYRQFSVLEGSRVDLQAACANKPLRQATVEIGDESIPLIAADDTRRTWRLPAGDTPFSNISGPLSYRIQVQDEDGLRLDQPITGFIRIKADRPPRVQAEIVTRRVLPTARPRLAYEASDDYGVAQLKVRRQVLRGGGNSQMEEDSVEVALPGQAQAKARGSFALDLASLKLAKGDQVKITLEATDYRGAAPGRTAYSEALLLDVTDQRGVLAGMVEADERAARQIDTVIQRQMGIGEAK
ncbi:MAG: DUF4175 family protein [Pirellulales bacterium]